MARPTRRRALKTLATVAGSVPALRVLNSFAAGHSHAEQEGQKASPFQPLFFNPQEFATIAAVAARIIPSDATPGAREAKVEEYVDWMVKQNEKLQPVHRQGLQWLDRVARKKYGARYVRLAPLKQDAILRLLDSTASPGREVPPENEPGLKFWKSIRRLTIDGFYSSKVGLKELGYSGNTFLPEFRGCTHPEHNT